MSRLCRCATVNKARVSDSVPVPENERLAKSKQGGTTDF